MSELALELIILDDIQRLRSAISAADEEEIDRTLPNLQQHLLHNQSYQQLADERLLSEALRLLERCLDEEKRIELEGARQHLILIKKIHSKLYSVLNCAVSLDDLLKDHLSRWPQFIDEINFDFEDVAKTQLHNVRSQSKGNSYRLRAFFELYFTYLIEGGYNKIVQTLKPTVEKACASYERLQAFTVNGLFATGWGEVYGLIIRPDSQEGSGLIHCLNRSRVDSSIIQASENAFGYVRRVSPQSRYWDFQWEIERKDITFTGESIGMALTIGMLSQTEDFEIDAYTAFTGCVNWESGTIKQIEHLEEKLKAAAELAIRRVFIPQQKLENLEEFGNLDIIAVESITEIKDWLQKCNYDHARDPLERIALVKLKQLDVELRPLGIRRVSLTQRTEHLKQAVYSNYSGKVVVDVYHTKQLRVIVPKQHTDLAELVRQKCDKVFGSLSSPSPGSITNDESAAGERARSKYTILDSSLQNQLHMYFQGRTDTALKSEQNCLYRAEVMKSNKTVFVRQFKNGTLTLDGPPDLFNEIDSTVRSLLGMDDTGKETEATDTRQARLSAQIEAVKAIELGDYWIGTDESGKGDYYGPLVAAAVFVDSRIAALLTTLGVRDSKNLTDRQNIELAEQIRQVCGKRAQVVTIPPESYNRLYSQMTYEGKNLNTLLAWAHTRALENILTDFPQKSVTVIIDKFADEHYIKDKLMSSARQTDLQLVQLPKAEANVAVAAASILARAQFLESLRKLNQEYGVLFPKGSSDPNIVSIGKQVIKNKGQGTLSKIAKLHFKTTKNILPLE